MTLVEQTPDTRSAIGAMDRKGRATSRGWGTLATYAILLGGALITLGPFALSIITSFKTPQQFSTESPLSLPAPFTMQNYAGLFSGELVDFGHSIIVTAGYVLVVLVGQLTFSILAAFAFARLRFPGRDVLFWLYLSTLMIPAVVTVVPLYLMLTEAGLRNTFWGIVLPYMFGSPYAIFLLREYFRGIPEEIVDAARIDGAGTWRILTRIMVPLSRPIIVTLTIITIVTHWNNFLWPLIITGSPSLSVITVATASMQSQYNGNWTIVMAATTLAMAPLIIIFLIFNRQIVNSIAITSFR
ncbi:sugar ABC transporter permease [Sinomonas atrocyanea]|uniref:Sugar ABC transporter permease n=1 Tax=Sinomonas atrocyanea TaxID=37927 RepID=A0A127A1P9_9MICC|nr:carbohydrate ABC transporter permease [Sinomonas atrocyanea]AMM31572.1 sugar ABC transporter permease [Sinomonas atrocyanea]GEB66354.1 ABC transporter permease [Sinomonas atrocyanea]GGG70110.1 ABC transporter permease [Sinomonas atrocyanea]